MGIQAKNNDFLDLTATVRQQKRKRSPLARGHRTNFHRNPFFDQKMSSIFLFVEITHFSFFLFWPVLLLRPKRWLEGKKRERERENIDGYLLTDCIASVAGCGRILFFLSLVAEGKKRETISFALPLRSSSFSSSLTSSGHKMFSAERNNLPLRPSAKYPKEMIAIDK